MEGRSGGPHVTPMLTWSPSSARAAWDLGLPRPGPLPPTQVEAPSEATSREKAALGLEPAGAKVTVAVWHQPQMKCDRDVWMSIGVSSGRQSVVLTAPWSVCRSPLWGPQLHGPVAAEPGYQLGGPQGLGFHPMVPWTLVSLEQGLP